MNSGLGEKVGDRYEAEETTIGYWKDTDAAQSWRNTTAFRKFKKTRMVLKKRYIHLICDYFGTSANFLV